MSEIKELDMSKYYVLKSEDIRQLSDEEKNMLKGIEAHIEYNRKLSNKKPFKFNEYLILNLDDMIDLEQLVFTIQENYHILGKAGLYKIKVEKLAVDLVNAILKAKEQSK